MSARKEKHKIKVVVISGHALSAAHTYVNCALIDADVGRVWKRYQAKTPLGEGPSPTWKKSLVFGGMPSELAFALRFDVFDAESKSCLGRVLIEKEDSLKAMEAWKESNGKPNESWSKWYALKNPAAKAKGFLHIALVPPSVKTADANLNPPVPPPQAKIPQSLEPAVKDSKWRKVMNPVDSLSASQPKTKPQKPEKPWTEERRAKAKKKRVPARQEIIDSEETYLKNLKALQEQYVDPMAEVVSAAEHKKMFTDIKGIYSFHQLFFPFMQKTEDVGDCFVKYADYLKIYTEYINHYADVIQTLSELRKNKKFTNFLKTARKSASSEITGYLIQPVQRIPRYVLLLKELKKYTWPEHKEHDNLVKALAKAQEIATHVNERKRQIENMSKTLEVQSKITGEFDSLIKPDRKMIREDKLIKVSTGMFNSIKRKERIVFLFSDLLMWTTTTYQYRGRMSLPAARLEKTKRMDLGVEVSSSRELCTLIFESEKQMDDWIKDFEEGKKYAKQVRDRLRQVKRRTLDSKRGKAHTLVMNAFKTLEKKTTSSQENLRTGDNDEQD
uniref:DH domain-containing protein n=1 Tax=Lotharella globosa TaxID=91324 RepID=A0A7S3ZCI0_9EUKA|mmetsp:Transcript_2403/g.4641  ORF Transcript_2403/g.4641 Transcript_2403/m.4641 type:complete len:558 (-) Transcript_2403:320-1993(-)|eukprot:CAMPEP_0167790416 /NCGR_PEP_ID=MMETSP0111_2-20121227/11303_1 /TAXON_ID=91324 /ORGANISM="Lotharella globosa, Strain CCCM811" /LENGTH=557 /DNA_ID=CAMNT_0007682841 /DNA_START=33 /DNA_END=1706 /DNA_ORIENTATION=+